VDSFACQYSRRGDQGAEKRWRRTTLRTCIPHGNASIATKIWVLVEIFSECRRDWCTRRAPTWSRDLNESVRHTSTATSGVTTFLPNGYSNQARQPESEEAPRCKMWPRFEGDHEKHKTAHASCAATKNSFTLQLLCRDRPSRDSRPMQRRRAHAPRSYTTSPNASTRAGEHPQGRR